MSTFKLGVAGAACALAMFPSVSVSAAQGIIPPATAHFSGTCLEKLDSGSVKMSFSNQNPACDDLNVEHTNRFGLTWKPNPGGTITVGWRATQPSGSSFGAHALSYDEDGVQYGSSGFVNGAGTKSQTIYRTPGVVLLETRWTKTSYAAAVPELNLIYHNLY